MIPGDKASRSRCYRIDALPWRIGHVVSDRLSAILREGGFASVRRATEGPFNMALEAR